MMIPPKQIIIAFTAITASNALILHPSPPPIFRRNLIALHVLNNNDDYDGRPSYRRYQRDSGGESKNRFRTTNNSNYNTNNNSEDEAYELARELASRRGLNLSSRDYNTEQPPPPMDSYTADYDYVPPTYGSDYGGVSEQELPRIPMDYNSANRNYNEGYGSGMGGGGLKELTWGGLKEQNDQRLNERYNTEVRRSSSSSSSTSVGRRYKNPQPPRQPPREVRPTDYRSSRNDRLYQSGPSSQRSQASMGRRANTNYDQVMRGSRTQQQQPRQPPPPLKRSNTGYGSYEEVKRVNKLSELASTSERMDGPAARRHMSQYPGPNNNAPYNNRPNNNIPYEQPPFRPPSTMSGFAPTAEQMGRSVGSVPPPQFMPPQQQQPPPPYVQMPQYQQQQQQRGRQARNNLRPPTSIPLSQLALQPHIQPVDQPSSQQQSSSFSAEFAQQQQQSQQMSGGYNDRRQQQQPPPSSFSAGRSQSESFGSNPSASFTPLPFQQLSQADFTRPFQGGSSEQQSQQQSTSSSGAARQSRPEFGGGGGGSPPPPEFGGPPPGFDQGAGPPPPFGQGPPPPPFGPDVHIFQNPFMNDPMFQRPQTTPTTQRKPNDENVKVPKDPNIEKMRRRAVSNSSSSSSKNNPGSGMKIPKDPVIERRRRQQQQQQEQQSTSQSTKVPRDPFLERQRNQQRTQGTTSARSSNRQEEEEEVRVPKEPTRLRTTQPTEERRPKEPKPKMSNNDTIRIPREPTMNASKKDKTPKEPQRSNNNKRVDGKGDDMTYEDFASFFDMPKL